MNFGHGRQKTPPFKGARGDSEMKKDETMTR